MTFFYSIVQSLVLYDRMVQVLLQIQYHQLCDTESLCNVQSSRKECSQSHVDFSAFHKIISPNLQNVFLWSGHIFYYQLCDTTLVQPEEGMQLMPVKHSRVDCQLDFSAFHLQRIYQIFKTAFL